MVKRTNKHQKTPGQRFITKTQKSILAILTVLLVICIGSYVIIRSYAFSVGPHYSVDGDYTSTGQNMYLHLYQGAAGKTYTIDWTITFDGSGSYTKSGTFSGSAQLSNAKSLFTNHYQFSVSSGCVQPVYTINSHGMPSTNSGEQPNQGTQGNATGPGCNGGSGSTGSTGGGPAPNPAPSPTPAPTPSPTPTPSPSSGSSGSGSSGGGGSGTSTPSSTQSKNSAAKNTPAPAQQSTQPNPTPVTTTQGNTTTQPAKPAPSPFYDGKQYAPGSDSDQVAAVDTPNNKLVHYIAATAIAGGVIVSLGIMAVIVVLIINARASVRRR